MKENPFEYNLGEKVFYLNNGDIIEGYISMRQCTDQLHEARSRKLTERKVRNILYSFKSIHSGNRSFGAVPTYDLFRTKEEAAKQLLKKAGIDIGIIEITI